MDDRRKAIAQACLEAADAGTMAFPQIVRTLMEAGFESYAIDFRHARAIYTTVEGDSVELAAHPVEGKIAAAFDAERLQAAIRDAQRNAPGYTYRGFCERAAASGCAGYLVSFLGRRALYIGRTGETHVELFPS